MNNMNIMVYIDGSDEAFCAMEYGIYLAKQHPYAKLFGAYIMNTHALNELIKSRILLENERTEYENEMKSDASKYLEQFEKMAHKKGIEANCLQNSGIIHLKMKEFIDQHHIDLLVVGQIDHVKNHEERDIDHLIRYVPCSVLIAKDERYIDKLYKAI